MDISKIFCFLGLHDWYYGNFQTGEMSKWTGDHVGVRGRSCVNCNKNQIKKKKKYVTVDSFEKQSNE